MVNLSMKVQFFEIMDCFQSVYPPDDESTGFRNFALEAQ